MNIDQELVTVKELAKRWRSSPLTVWRISDRHADILKPVKIGGKLLFESSNIEKYETTRRVLKG
ncbi:MAG: hypothetical protein ACI8ZB_002669 [Desulforhopalus sp.]|jgi:hypothetical protein